MAGAARRPGTVRGAAYGVVVEIRVDDHRLLPSVRQRCPPGWKAARRKVPQATLGLSHRQGLSVEVDGVEVAVGLSHESALDVLESELQLLVARLAQPAVFVHAGVVSIGGQAIVLPGRSGAGKTTLVRALVAAGARYYSDEYAVLDAQGRVHPYARRPSVRTPRGPKRREPVPRRRGRGPIPLGVVVQTEYSTGAQWKPVALTAGEQVIALLSHAVAARDRPREVLATLARAVSGSRGFRSQRGSADRTARALVALAARPGAGGSVRAWRLPVASSRGVGGVDSSPRSSKERRSSMSRRRTGRSV